MLKILGGFGAVVAAGAYFTGALSTDYSRTVGRPQADVMAALSDLDITAPPGSPGTDPVTSGGIRPLFRLATTANSMTWYVMSGNKVATAMTATFEPVGDGKETRVRASVERGDAPDNVVSPAFRSEGITLGLFTMAIEGELDKLVSPVTKSADECRDLAEQMMHPPRVGPSPPENATNLAIAIGGTAKSILKLGAMEAELRRAGCDTSGNGQFQPVSNMMGSAPPPPSGRGHDSQPDVIIEPGKPMIDPTQK